ncbi:MAG: glycosyltransferase family 4 protein [Anaerolineales bacterium]
MVCVEKIIKSGEFDLIHAHASKPGYLARLAAVGSGIPVIYSPHCFSFHAGVGKLQANILAILERFAARYLTTKFMVVANGEKTLAQKYKVGSPEQFVTIYNGIDVEESTRFYQQNVLKKELGLSEDIQLVGAVGRLNQQKGPFDFIKMVARVHSVIPNTRFVWIGTGPLDQEARQLSKELNLDQILYFLGQRTDVAELLRSLDCFVLPSLWEGFSIVLLEAMAAKAPIVATDILGNNEAIRSGIDGWLVEPGNIEAMADKVISLITSPDLAISFGSSSYSRVKAEFNKKKMLESLENLYSTHF